MHHPTDRITHTTAFTPVMEHWLEREIAQWVHPMKDRSDDPSHHDLTTYKLLFQDAMQRDMFVSTLDESFKEHGNILNPISAQARVTRRTSVLPLRCPTSPRINIDISLDNISFALTSEQYQCVALWQSEFERHGLRRQYRKHRPDTTIKERSIVVANYFLHDSPSRFSVVVNVLDM